MRLALALVCLLAAWANAHEVRPAYLQITEIEPERFEVLWKQPVLGDRRLPIDPVLPEACMPVTATTPEHTGSALIQSWQIQCSLREGVLGISGLTATLTDVMLRIAYLNGEVISQLLRASSPSLDLTQPTPRAGAYFVLGMEHLLFGIDHILFVIGLVLFIRNPLTLVKTITAFTLAHSITLALSVLHLVTLSQGPIEAVIALSIVFLARELMVPEADRSRITQAAPWVMALTFGLLHGFGFAGALAAIGLPRDQLGMSLLLFNLGIEAGQLLVIGLMLASIWLARRLLTGPAPLIERTFASAMGCVAGFWTIDRILAAI